MGSAESKKLFRGLLNRRRSPSFEFMERIASREQSVIGPAGQDGFPIRTPNPVVLEMVHVAKEIVASGDEALAKASMQTFSDSLTRLTEVSKALRQQDPSTNSIVEDMRADVCGADPELHEKECTHFMNDYCRDKSGNASCEDFFEKTDPEKAKKLKESAGGAKGDENNPDKEEPKDDSEQDALEAENAEGVPLPEQGFTGSRVTHVDGLTTTDDWRMEFGPAQQDTYESICAEHPDNQWCRSRGLHKNSATGTKGDGLTALVASIVVTFVVGSLTVVT